MDYAVSCIRKELNREQFQAVTAPYDRHRLILAGAGCGKTTVLVRRVAFLYHYSPAIPNMLALTFTRKAAEEMAQRVKRQIAVAADRVVVVSTFHAFCLSVLQGCFSGISNFERIGFSAHPHSITAEQRLELLALCSTAVERRSLQVDLIHLDALIERHTVFPESLQPHDASHTIVLQAIVERFNKQKRERGWWDFSDLIIGVIFLFTQHKELLNHYQTYFQAILVDEFQDTNPQQQQLLQLLLAGRMFLFAVGDDDQAIYRFRGADVRPTLSFTTYFTGAEVMKLQINYRSKPAILKTANRVFRHKKRSFRKNLISGKFAPHTGSPPTVHHFENQQVLGTWILDRASAIASRTAFPVSSMAVLFRINQTAVWMQHYFAQFYPGVACPQLLTVHKSKGLEFPVVFLTDLEEGIFPLYRLGKKGRIKNPVDFFKHLFCTPGGQDHSIFDEELRLFYVAVTRAEHQLFCCTTRSKKLYGRNQRLSRSRYLRYI